NVVLEGTQIGSTTDLDGNFLLTNIPVGSYNLVVSYISYKTKKLEGINVEAGKVLIINTDLEENVAQMQEVVVVAQRETYSEVSVINEIKLSSQVITGISAEQISKTQDKDAAQVMSRVPGVTIVDSRFVMIRGVNSRYNSVLINDATAPSTEIDSRAFAFDLIPSSMLDRMLIFKSGSSDLPGDFAGGVIKTYTRNHVGENFTTVSLGTGYRTNTTFKPYYYTQGSKTDFLGYDNGFRALPSSFPNTDELKDSNRNSELRERAGRSLSNNFAYQERPASPDFKLGITLGRKFNIGEVKVSNITSLNYSNSYQAMYVERNRYFAYAPNRPIEKRFQYFDDFTSNDVRVGVLHNWTFDLPGKNRIEFRNMFNQLGENETIIRRGTDFLQRPDQDFKNYSYHYLSRAIYSGQLQGMHTFANDKAKITWVGGLNYLNRNEPDYRRFRTFRDKTDRGTEAPYIMQLPPSANLFETGRFYSKLDEMAVAHGTNLEYRFSEKEENAFTIKVGYYTEFRDRTFRARYVSYLYPSFFDATEGERLKRLPLSTIFSPENIKRQDGFVIEEGTRPTDRYTATNKLYAGYVGFTIPITSRLDFSGGVRLEHNDQVLNSQDDLGKVRGGQKVTNPLYFGNLSYDITDKMLV
ncbi:MAG: TonB-dependent receptor, partial [Flammeovirgaceae bacterium]|nr:TonB-dependent receptor [Flammeovirgaceae bacterium]MDW8288136.1 carboxypeptidase-like regulatory domain-containing protein [Flammeovirgaceae bacterium]